MKGTIRALFGFVVVPLAVYVALLAFADAYGSATIMLGAAAGSSGAALLAMASALALRLYLVLVLPGLVLSRVVLLGFQIATRKKTPPQPTFSKPNTSTSTPGQ